MAFGGSVPHRSATGNAKLSSSIVGDYRNRSLFVSKSLGHTSFFCKKIIPLRYCNISYGYLVHLVSITSIVIRVPVHGDFYSKWPIVLSQLWGIVKKDPYSVVSFCTQLFSDYRHFKRTIDSKRSSPAPISVTIPSFCSSTGSTFLVNKTKVPHCYCGPFCGSTSFFSSSKAVIGSLPFAYVNKNFKGKPSLLFLPVDYLNQFIHQGKHTVFSFTPDLGVLAHVHRLECIRSRSQASKVYQVPPPPSNFVTKDEIRHELKRYALEFLQRHPHEIFHPILKVYCGTTRHSALGHDLGMFNPVKLISNAPTLNKHGPSTNNTGNARSGNFTRPSTAVPPRRHGRIGAPF